HARKELKTRDRVRLHLGTGEIIGRVVLLDVDRVLPGQSSLVQLVLESPAVALPQDRFIIRTFSPLLTIGGGEVMDTSPARHKRFDAALLQGLRKLEGSLEDRIEQTLLKTMARSRAPDELSLALGKNVQAVCQALHNLVAAEKLREVASEKERRYLHAEGWKRIGLETQSAVRDYFEKNPTRQFIPLADLQSQLVKLADDLTFRLVLRSLADQKLLLLKESAVGLPERQASPQPQEQELTRRIEAAFGRAGFEPPLEEDVCRELGLSPHYFRKMMSTLIQEGKLVRLDKRVTYHRDWLEKAKQIVMDHLRQHESISIAALKDNIRVSRKYACAILEYFDAVRLTKRSGDAHVLK
ncbi:MAG: SelB C-terminal domain-containing protein, partial [Acidobacteriota bacterium]